MAGNSWREIAKRVPGARAVVRAAKGGMVLPEWSGASRLAARFQELTASWREARYRLSPLNWPATERMLLALLERRIARRIRHDWYESGDPPHFSYSNYNALAFSFFARMPGPGILLRGFLSSEMVRPGDRVLDIGCGDGFFTKRFLAIDASHVDAIDLDPLALEFARCYNLDPKVSYHLLDAVTAPFPASGYDVVVWDGAIGHFSRDVTNRMFGKIKAAMKVEGVFCGSEQLGKVAATDHPQHWETLEEVAAMLRPHFRSVALRSIEHFYDLGRTARREEFYWRASDSSAALQRADFRIA